MEFINANLINLELELKLNNKTASNVSQAKTVAKVGGSREEKAVLETPVAAVPPLVHLQESRGWITQEKFTKRLKFRFSLRWRLSRDP